MLVVPTTVHRHETPRSVNDRRAAIDRHDQTPRALSPVAWIVGFDAEQRQRLTTPLQHAELSVVHVANEQEWLALLEPSSTLEPPSMPSPAENPPPLPPLPSLVVVDAGRVSPRVMTGVCELAELPEVDVLISSDPEGVGFSALLVELQTRLQRRNASGVAPL